MGRLLILLSTLFLLGPSSLVLAQDRGDSAQYAPNYRFRIAPYFWFINLKGNIEAPPKPSNYPEIQPKHNFDLSFDEIRNELKFALLLSTEFERNRWVFDADFAGFALEGQLTTPSQLVLEDINYRFSFSFLEVSASYKIFDKKKWHWDGLVGGRWTHAVLSGEITFNKGEDIVYEKRTNDLFDPILGTRVVYSPWDPLEFVAYVDVGPFNPKIDLSYQIVGSVNYHFAKIVYASLIYRDLNVRTAKDDALFTGKVYGPALRLGFQF